ncbi:MAG: adenylate kinase family protein [Candidatus Methanoperedenaceae archaeon]|nr:adenylate kinase family protein [Candidatus Methanoperedenaceae archaeon]
MIAALTGTPGTGKTSVCTAVMENQELCGLYHIIELNKLVFGEGLHTGKDNIRDSYAVDTGKLEKKVKQETSLVPGGVDIIMDGHLSHLLPADIVIVLRTEPGEIMTRLLKRNYSSGKIRENADAEALDVILVESVEVCDKVFEINTTGKSPQDVAGYVISIIESVKTGKNPEKFLPGKINWIEQAGL